MDFTLGTYKNLCDALSNRGFSFCSFDEFTSKPIDKVMILRHDVDRLPLNSLEFAKIQNEMRVRGSYYFRAVLESWDESIIKKNYSLGHEIGYHYEDLSFAWAKLKTQGTGHRAQGKELEKKVVDIAIESFQRNLERLRKIVSVKTICMHGNPMSRWDSRLLWKYYDYKDFGIESEPYFDVDFSNVLYLTDTGRCWNGGKFSIRDKGLGIRKEGIGKRDEESGDPYYDWVVKPKVGSLMRLTEKGVEFQSRYNFRSTNDIIRAAEMGELPDKIMMTFHPQRWTDKTVPWVKELVWQNVKNVVKYYMIRIRD